MSEPKWTPGPWHVGDIKRDSQQVYDADGWNIATCAALTIRSKDEVKANASLMASAPDLFEALRDARDNGLIYWEPNTERGHATKARMLARIDAALAKAGAADGEG